MATLAQQVERQHGHLCHLAQIVRSLATQLALPDPGQEAMDIAADLDATKKVFASLEAPSDATQEVLEDVKRYAGGVIDAQSRALAEDVKKAHASTVLEVNDRFRKLEARILGEVGKEEESDVPGKFRMSGKAADTQVLRKVASRLSDFEAQVTAQMQSIQQDMDRKVQFLATGKDAPIESRGKGMDEMAQDVNALKYDMGELKDLITNARNDTNHVKRIVLACERDMEDFTAAMDAVNVDLDEMRARVDSTHSIITSRQRVEATVTAEISTMRLDMGDMQEALKAHDAWMEDVSQSLQECHERTGQLSQDILSLRDQTQAKLDGKVDVVGWHESNSDLDGSIKTVRDMVSTLRLEVDSRRRKVDDALEQHRRELGKQQEATDRHVQDLYAKLKEEDDILHQRLDNLKAAHEQLSVAHHECADGLRKACETQDASKALLLANIQSAEQSVSKALDDKNKEINERIDGVERHIANTNKETARRLNTVDLRISGLQGACGEHKRDIAKLREEANTLTVQSAAHDVDIGKHTDDLKKLERMRAEDQLRSKQDMDAVYEELDQKLYEKNHVALEDHVCKLSRGVVKLSQVVGVFPGARMDDGTEEELDIDVELLNWEDCCQHMAARVDKMWKQHSAAKYKSMLDLLSKKADHSVLRLLQISQQHIESQLERVRHERELWKEVVDKRAQQPLQLALTLKDQAAMQQAQYGMMGAPMGAPQHATPRGMPPVDAPGPGQMKQSPLVKRMQHQAKPQEPKR